MTNNLLPDCANIGNVLFNRWMFTLTADAKYIGPFEMTVWLPVVR